MAIVKCHNGHFFDNERYAECPICNNDYLQTDKKGETVWLNPTEVTDEGLTIGVYSDFHGNDFVTGWIVCVDGPDKGRDYRLHQGYNRVGRGMNMDICPENDLLISRSNHCSIVYEEKKNQFYFIPEPGQISYLNQNLAETVSQLKTGDTFQIGKSEFEFVAFCREGRRW